MIYYPVAKKASPCAARRHRMALYLLLATPNGEAPDAGEWMDGGGPDAHRNFFFSESTGKIQTSTGKIQDGMYCSVVQRRQGQLSPRLLVDGGEAKKNQRSGCSHTHTCSLFADDRFCWKKRKGKKARIIHDDPGLAFVFPCLEWFCLSFFQVRSVDAAFRAWVKQISPCLLTTDAA
jgi:hypothetical protein